MTMSHDTGEGVLRRIWDAGTEAQPPAMADAPAGIDSPHWPIAALPDVALTPAGQGRMPVTVIAAFGVSAERLAKIVEEVAVLTRGPKGLRPLFVTDAGGHHVFRRAQVPYEYFPKALYGAPAQTPRFAARFALLWAKWQAAALIDFSAPGVLRARLDNYDALLGANADQPQPYNPRPKAPPRAPLVAPDIAALRAEYMGKGLDKARDDFALYRILGNDLPPRHAAGQTFENLKFILTHEPAFEACKKHWIVNRIIDPAEEARILDLLDTHDQSYIHLPFDQEAYARAPWHIEGFPDAAFMLKGRYHQMAPYDQLRAQAHLRRDKILYLANNNGARNAALADGRGRAKWILPWDGNCFLTEQAWADLVAGLKERPYFKYFCVPMQRLQDNQMAFSKTLTVAEAVEEPQLIFRQDASEDFDDSVPYGRRPKVDLLWRLGVRGPWDQWRDDVWDPARPALSAEAGAVGQTGWVARLASGRGDLEATAAGTSLARATARSEGMIGVLDALDEQVTRQHLKPDALFSYDATTLAALREAPAGSQMALIFDRLQVEAQLAVARPVQAVTDKPVSAPLDVPQDFFSISQPSASVPDAWPPQLRLWMHHRGLSVEDTMDALDDRARFRRMSEDVTVLTLAGVATGEGAYLQQAAARVRVWFLEDATAMSPHLELANADLRKAPAEGTRNGILALHGLPHLLDAIRLLHAHDAVSDTDAQGLRRWFEAYLDWLQDSALGQAARASSDHIGTSYDLQVAALAAYLARVDVLNQTFLRCRLRLPAQIGRAGEQKIEKASSVSAHDCTFNLQAWMYLANIARGCGDDLWRYKTADGRALETALVWYLKQFKGSEWAHAQKARFDPDRVLPLVFLGQAQFAGRYGVTAAFQLTRKPVFRAQDGVMPFWMLGTGLRDVDGLTNPTTVDLLQRRGYAARTRSQEGMARKLPVTAAEDRLWGGYAAPAIAALEQRTTGQDNATTQAAAHWALARWHAHQGDWATCLAALDAVPSRKMRDGRAYALLKTQSLCHLGQQDQARALITESLATRPDDPSRTFALANTYVDDPHLPTEAADQMRIDLFNRVFWAAGLGGVGKRVADQPFSYTNIAGQGRAPREDGPKVSVIVPVYNGAETIAVTLRGLLDQTWENLEILVCDDASTDDTAAIVDQISTQDARVHLLRTTENGGAYSARNRGWAQATGDVITVHDADDWSHPQKVARQMQALLRRQGPAAVLTEWGRFDPRLYALGNWRATESLFAANHSSLLFSREIMETMGPWDPVRIGADMEFLWRLTTRFGDEVVQTISPGVPLSFSLSRPDALTRNEATHVRTVYHGLRLDYRRAYRRWQKAQRPEDLTLPVGTRAFPAPVNILPNRPEARQFDLLVLADVSNAAVDRDAHLQVLSACAAAEGRIGVFHWPDYDRSVNADMSPECAALLDSGAIAQVHAFDSVETERLVLLDPYLARLPIAGLPETTPKQLIVLGSEASSSQACFDPRRRRLPTSDELTALFGTVPTWQTAARFTEDLGAFLKGG